ncbi:protein kinase family protein [Kitasatospora sp. NPDC001175]|uniref:serine/threonine protein kinase n=1 Tax=Kitasatospora sp. NPDC001175 TaxID=3157103 RepID=UPI003D050F02
MKAATTASSAESLRRADRFHEAVRHEVIVPQLHQFTVGGLPAVVMPWFEGEVLYAATRTGGEDRTAPSSAMARFRTQPLQRVLDAVESVLEAHLAVEEAGFVAVDFYDGCLLYDFTTGRLRLCDLDEYRPGPFTVEGERLPGSKRFMAPEEFRRGAEINARTTVFNLGRAARLLLDAGDTESHWRGSTAQLAVVVKATDSRPELRYSSAGELLAAWRAAGPPGG